MSSMSNIFLKTCPACALSVSRDTGICRCGHSFGDDDGDAHSDARLYLEYLEAREQQARATIRAAAEGFARDAAMKELDEVRVQISQVKDILHTIPAPAPKMKSPPSKARPRAEVPSAPRRAQASRPVARTRASETRVAPPRTLPPIDWDPGVPVPVAPAASIASPSIQRSVPAPAARQTAASIEVQMVGTALETQVGEVTHVATAVAATIAVRVSTSAPAPETSPIPAPARAAGEPPARHLSAKQSVSARPTGERKKIRAIYGDRVRAAAKELQDQLSRLRRGLSAAPQSLVRSISLDSVAQLAPDAIDAAEARIATASAHKTEIPTLTDIVEGEPADETTVEAGPRGERIEPVMTPSLEMPEFVEEVVLDSVPVQEPDLTPEVVPSARREPVVARAPESPPPVLLRRDAPTVHDAGELLRHATTGSVSTDHRPDLPEAQEVMPPDVRTRLRAEAEQVVKKQRAVRLVECPHCTAQVPDDTARCGCGYEFARASLVPSLSLDPVEQARLDALKPH